MQIYYLIIGVGNIAQVNQVTSHQITNSKINSRCIKDAAVKMKSHS